MTVSNWGPPHQEAHQSFTLKITSSFMGPRPGPVKIRSTRRIGNWEKPSRTWLLSWRSGWWGKRSPSGSTSPFWQGLVTGVSICDLRVILGIKGHQNQCWAPSSLTLKGFWMLHHSYTSQQMLPTLTRSRPAHRTIWLFTLKPYTAPDRVPGTQGWRQSQVLADNFWYSFSLLFPLKKTHYYTFFSQCDLVFSHLKEVTAAIKIQSEQLRDTRSDLLYPHSRFKATFTDCWQFGV